MTLEGFINQWSTLFLSVYYLIVIAVCCIVIYNTKSPAKASAYLLLVTFLPVAGIFVYFSFGFNYRKREIYSKKIIKDDNLLAQVIRAVNDNSRKILQNKPEAFGNFDSVAKMVLKNENSLISDNNCVDLLINGEQKFPRLLDDLRAAEKNIHLEY
ncbi:MAG: cardiolipin synthase, partial [Flavobacterium sp.]|nr:cardiolipin synthase [Flavobacterium sp.]